jgi:pyruvate,water dikinase
VTTAPLTPAIALPAEAAEVLRPLELVGTRRSYGPRRMGGKAFLLARLAREGFPVPRGFVLDARWFERAVDAALPKGHDVATLIKLASTAGGVERAARAYERLLSTPLPDEVARALDALWARVEPTAPWGLAVRSSGTCEDGEATSLAGLAESVLGVRGPEALAAAVRRVWASAVLPRSIAYLAHAGSRDLAMAVLIQPMVVAEAAGVLFTAPPPGLDGAHWAKDERLVSATLGLGAPVVDGATASDSYRLAREGGALVASVIARKTKALVVGARGTEVRDVPPSEGDRPAIGGDALRELALLATQLERELGGGPLDVEFAVTRAPGGEARVAILQARPVTGGGYPEGGDERSVWSRANVGEALPGAATPLTWSIARAFAEKGFREAFGALGCKVPRDASLVANVHGRFYLHLTAFMRIAAEVPGLEPRALLEASGGATDAAIAALEGGVEGVSRRAFWLRLPLTAPRLVATQARLARDVARFEADAARQRKALLEMDLTLLPDDALVTTLKGASALLDRTGTLMLSCASASLASHLALCRLLAAVTSGKASPRDHDDPGTGGDATPEGAAHLAQMLTGGAHEIESAGPGVALARVAAVARDEDAAREALSSGRVRSIEDLPPGPTRRAFARFLEAYGDRGVREAELASPRWSEDPSSVLAMLAASLRGPVGDPDAALARARSLADRELARLETQLGAVKLAAVRLLVGRSQHFTRLRERMRAWVSRVLGMLRAIALDVDARLRRIDPSLPQGSVFFCTYAELVAALRTGRAELGPIVRLRSAEHARDAGRPDPPPVFIGRPPPIVLPPVAGERLAGLPASGGVVEGLVRVLDAGVGGALDELRPGEVLVTRTTDVGLSPLFLVAAAVVTELGGPLSHAAIVAREYGLPAVVNVPGATVALRTGDRVRVDGDRGLVERIEAARGGGAS